MMERQSQDPGVSIWVEHLRFTKFQLNHVHVHRTISINHLKTRRFPHVRQAPKHTILRLLKFGAREQAYSQVPGRTWEEPFEVV